ncbi:helix-hairpin-helix domain-containing protein [Rapidithrix thailandica]|uniref:Helix-hairpin-helix domain-containing protein n=1 Tax=Rapidithrix thailandica TaxID=413964 RepID=A0AAW9RTU8_9BACT
MKRLKQYLRSYFAFSQKEINGFLVLMGLMLMLLVGPLILKYTVKTETSISSRDQRLLDSMSAKLNASFLSKSSLHTSKDTLFYFDPNTLDKQGWLNLGVPEFLADRIKKYCSKGGQFRQQGDLAKIYGFPEPLFLKLKPYIKLPKSAQKKLMKEKLMYASHKKKRSTFDINTADTLQLKKIRGIGTKLSARIVKFRDKLGGFHNLEQLKEVYGLPPETCEELLKYARLESKTLTQIAINTADLNTLKAHPYINYKLAKVIVNYRQQHGPYHSLEDLQKIELFSEQDAQKLQAYLQFD